tara:strand:+ start:188 stop:538 length:351 start_codon:yes stop_codon:yes gene_type:complete
MSKYYPNILEELNEAVSRLDEGISDVMEGYFAMSSAAKADGHLDKKTKELIATAIGVAVKCDSCIASHIKGAGKNGATREEVLEALGVAVFMGGGPSVVYASQALEAFDQLTTRVD